MEIPCCGPRWGGGAQDRNLTVDLPTTTTTITTTMTPGENPANTDKEPPSQAEAAPPPPPLLAVWRLTWPLLVKVVLSNRK